jgi:phenylacetate-CoA ligase
MNKAFEIVYNNSPSFLQNLWVSLYGLKIFFREYGKKFQKKLDEFEKMQWYSLDELKEYQNEKLKALIKHCYENVPYYRMVMDQNKLKPSDIKSVDDLYKLPILTRDDVKKNYQKLIATNFKRYQLSHGHTNGTTGSPLHIVWDNRTCLIKNVVDWRQKRWAGLNPGDRMAFFLSRTVVPLERTKPPFWRHNWFLNHLFFSGFHMCQENLAAYYKQLKSFRPKLVEGYPSTIYIMGRFLLSTNRTLPVQTVFTSSEPLMPHQRETIEKAFECKVFDSYGMAERVVFAGECRSHEGKHLNSDFGITEILTKDGESAAVGQMGRIIASGLHNYAMPLLRYQTSDVTALKAKQCSCGRSFPLMEDVTTRDVEIVTTKDGRYISPLILSALYLDLYTVSESQFIQEDLEHIRMKIVKGPGYKEKDTHYLLQELKKTLGEDMKVEIEFVDSIPRTKVGKFRWVISKVPLEF